VTTFGTRPRWERFLGLPHCIGADPEDGVGADCLLLAYRLQEYRGAYHPPLDPIWFEQARREEWGQLQAAWDSLTIARPLQHRELPPEGALLKLTNPSGGLCIATVTDNCVVLVHETRGVTKLPIALIHLNQFYEFRRPFFAVPTAHTLDTHVVAEVA
jgi:hypothetical protein